MSWDYDNGFSPSTVSISPGEKVIFQNMDIYGFSVQINIGSSLTFTLARYEGAQVTFPYGGSYGVSSDWGDQASVIVNVPPSVTITNPANSAVFSAPATFTVKASASDADGVSSVEFWLDSISGSELLGTDFDAPYSIEVANLVAGDYAIRAIASDGYSQSSDSINITVTAAPPLITLANPRISNGEFSFDVDGLTIGKTNVLQYSTNLVQWTSIATNVAEISGFTHASLMTAKPRYYRIFQIP